MSGVSSVGKRVAIIGVGISGLALATLLARRGMRVEVFEKAPEPQKLGAGIQISPNGMVVLRALGLQEADIEQESLHSDRVELYDARDARMLVGIDLQKSGREHRLFHRRDLISILTKLARDAGVDITFSKYLAKVDMSGTVPRWFDEDGQVYEADILIGADGLRSSVRHSLGMFWGEQDPHSDSSYFFTGQTAWRAVIPCDQSWRFPYKCKIYVGSGKHLVAYPLRNATLLNIVGVEERREWTEEGWTIPGDPVRMRQQFSTFPDEVRDWLERVEETWFWGLFRHNVARYWYKPFPKGRAVAILGDAAHTMLPFLAQGGNMALEDAFSLAQALDTQPMEAALADWQTRRILRCRKVVAAADRNATLYHLSGLPRFVAHFALNIGSKIAPDFIINSYRWIYDYDVTKTVI